jgi:hypothetical protein
MSATAGVWVAGGTGPLAVVGKPFTQERSC